MESERSQAASEKNAAHIRAMITRAEQIMKSDKDLSVANNVLQRAAECASRQIEVSRTDTAVKCCKVLIEGTTDCQVQLGMPNVRSSIIDFQFAEALDGMPGMKGDPLYLPTAGNKGELAMLLMPETVQKMFDAELGEDARPATQAFVDAIYAEGWDTKSREVTLPGDKERSVMDSLWGFGFYRWQHPSSEDSVERDEKPIDLQTYLRIMRTQPKVREEFFMHLKHIVRYGEKQFARAIVHRGYDTLRHLEEATDYDWYSGMTASLVARYNDIASGKLVEDQDEDDEDDDEDYNDEELTPEEKERRKNISEAIREFKDAAKEISKLLIPEQSMKSADREFYQNAMFYLSSHTKTDRREIRETLKCAERRDELRSAIARANWHEVAAIEQSIAADVYRQCVRFPPRVQEEDVVKCFEEGLPVQAVERRELSCFTSAWTVASFCIESGISYHQLHYCDVHEDSNNLSGTHAAILLELSDGNIIFIDPAGHQCGTPFKAEMCGDKKTQEKLDTFFTYANTNNMLGYLICQPVQVEIPPKTAELMNISKNFTVMSLDDGFGSGHFLHVGIDFLHQGKFDEAIYAFETALSFNIKCPNSWCYLGVVALQKNDLDDAERYLMQSLHCYNNFQLALYYLGVLALKRGDDNTALSYFTKVAADTRNVWNDGTYKKKAEEYIAGVTALQQFDK